MYNKRFTTLILCLCLPVTLALADTELEVKEIVVTATRTEEEILTAPGHVTVLSKEEISRSGAKNVADLLTRQAGVKINDYGAEGAQKIISIRGSSSSQVLILVNGVRQNDSNSGGADIASIPLENIERIEIIRGGFSSLYGADAVGGVINIITKRNADGQLKVKVENGTYIPRDAIEVSESATETPVDANLLDLVDTQKVDLNYSTIIGNSDLVVTARGTRAANHFVWNDEEYINDYRARINADLLSGGGYLSLSTSIGVGTVGANASINFQDVGAPGSIDPLWASSDARQKNLNAMAQVFLETDRFLTDLLSFDVQAYYKFARLTYENPPADANISDLQSFGLDAVQELVALDWLSLVYGANALFDFVKNTSYNKNRFSGGVFLELPIYPLPKLSIIPVIRYDYYSDFPGNFNFKLSSVYALNESIALKFSGGSSYRAPTFSDLYYPDDGFYVGNPDVEPEKGYFGELGASLSTESIVLDTYAFARYLIDGILWAFNSGIGRYEPTNINKVFYPGFEMNAEMNLWSDLWLTGTYTFVYSFILEDDTSSYTFADDKRAFNTPVHTADAGLEYRGANLTAGVSAEYVGEMETVYSGTLDDYFVLNALLRYKVSELLTLQAAVDNILNSTYEILGDYVAPPVSFWLGAELTL